MNSKTLKVAAAVAKQDHSPFFSTRSVRDLGASFDPFLTADLFHMSRPTFPPHPHAGFSAITYMLPESPGGFVNRDSGGDRSRIGPGEVHVTEAASGMMHEEIPEAPGVDCVGVQIFVKLPRATELGAPRAMHVDRSQMPVVSLGGGSLTVVAGRYGEHSSPMTPSYPFSLLDVTVAAGQLVSLALPAGDRVWGLVVAGTGSASSEVISEQHALLWQEGGTQIDLSAGPSALRILLGAGAPIGEPVQSRGPFAMTDVQRLDDARVRFSRGQMGSLTPSF